jgi:hypothetical protein
MREDICIAIALFSAFSIIVELWDAPEGGYS